MAEREIKFKITGDPTQLNQALDSAEKKAEKTASSFENIGKALIGAFAGSKISNFFKGALEDAAKLEQSMLKIAASARAFGQSAAEAKKAAVDLTKDGFLSMSQAAQTISNLMATGLNVDQAKKFIAAAKDITAFGNTIGDAAQAVEDLSLGLLRGSALVIDNASPALKSLANRYQQVLQTQGKAAAAQVAYNEVIKLGGKFAGDAALYMDTLTGAQKRFEASTHKAGAAIGTALGPALKNLYNLGTRVLLWLTDFIKGLDSSTVAIASAGVLIATAVGVIGVSLKALGFAFAAALGPISLFIAGIGLVVAAFTELLAVVSNSEGVRLVQEQKRLQDLVKELESTTTNTKKLAAAKKELSDVTEKLNSKFGETLRLLKAENLEYERKIDLIQKVERTQASLGGEERIQGLSNDELLREIAARRAESGVTGRAPVKLGRTQIGGLSADEAALAAFRGSEGGPSLNAVLERDPGTFIPRSEAAQDELAALLLEQRRRKGLKGKAADPAASKGVETRFIETAAKLKQIEDNLAVTLAKARLVSDATERKRRQDDARADARQQADEAVNAYKSSYAAFIEDKATVDKLALDKQTDDAIRAVREQVNAGRLMAADAENQLQEIREAHIKKEGELRLESYAATAEVASATTKALAELFKSKDVGSGLSGIGNVASTASKFSPALKGLGPAGQIFGAVGGVVSVFQSLFAKSDEERAIDAQRAEDQRKAQLEILELQENHLKDILALNEAAAKLPFEDLQRQLRLIDINAQKQRLAGGDEATIETQRLAARQAAQSGTLASQSGKIGEGQLFAGVGSSPDELIAFLSERAAQSVAVAQFNALLQTAAQGTPSSGRLTEILGQLNSYSGKIPAALFQTGTSGVQQSIAYLAAQEADYSFRINQSSSAVGGYAAKLDLIKGARINLANAQAWTGQLLAERVGAVAPLISEIGIDTGIADNLLTTIEQLYTTNLQIERNTGDTAANTAKFDLRKERDTFFLDLAGQGQRGFGAVRGAAVNPNAVTIGTGGSATILASTIIKSFDQMTAENTGKLVEIQTRALRVLIDMADKLQNTGTAGLTRTQLAQMIADLGALS